MQNFPNYCSYCKPFFQILLLISLAPESSITTKFITTPQVEEPSEGHYEIQNHGYVVDGSFDYKNAIQQDQLQMRYSLQQQVNVLQNAKLFNDGNYNRQSRQSVNRPNAEVKDHSNDLQKTEKIEKSDQNYVAPQLSSRSSDEASNSLDPVGIKQKDLYALRKLLHQAPHIQLLGLQRLLADSETNQQHTQSDISSEATHPLIENQKTNDIPDDRSHSHSMTNERIAALQAHLNNAATLHAQQALAAAQEKAAAHVEAQYTALAQKQTQLREAVLKKLSSQSIHIPRNTIIQIKEPICNQEDHSVAPSQIQENIGESVLWHGDSNVNYVQDEQSYPEFQAQHSVPIQLSEEHFHEAQNNHEEDIHGLTRNNKRYAQKYAFGYRISSSGDGNHYGHEERKDGHGTKGHYHVLLPDGRLQNVEYYADHTGYHARISYTSVGVS
ncbi:hypothetical protein HHI36_020160 [Cryptolaemus montrouzieri]|uniref:Uncharacterized protein n=1 Tax=Cryptolaemus montrouzieri TaxID=559131 RepID=A0ABD2NB52_9CUCU